MKQSAKKFATIMKKVKYSCLSKNLLENLIKHIFMLHLNGLLRLYRADTIVMLLYDIENSLSNLWFGFLIRILFAKSVAHKNTKKNRKWY